MDAQVATVRPINIAILALGGFCLNAQDSSATTTRKQATQSEDRKAAKNAQDKTSSARESGGDKGRDRKANHSTRDNATETGGEEGGKRKKQDQ